MSDLNKPFAAYRGDDPYVFVCYSHDDAEFVYADLSALDQNGIRLWYDEGIGAGESWRAEIAAAIEGATRLLFYISDSSLNSAHCLREVDYALNHDIDIVPVYLDDVNLPGELQLVLNRVQALFRKTDSRYLEHLVDALERQSPVARLVPRARKGGRRNLLPIIGVGVILIAAIAWLQYELRPGSQINNVPVSTGPSAFDNYLQGLELLERWDKGDNLDDAIGLFRDAASADPEFALAYARLADGLRIRYALTGDEASLEESTGYAEEAVRIDDGLAPVHIALGRVHAMQGNTDLAFAAIERALAIDVNDAVANQAMATMYARQGRPEDAEASFKKAIALDPENLAVLNSYANFVYNQSRLDEAASQWQAVIRLAPDHYPALVNLGSVLAELNRIPESITMYLQAIEIKPTYMAYSNLGTSYSRAGRYEDAIQAFQSAIELDDSDWLAWGNLAWVLSWNDPDSERAAATYARAIELAEAARQQSPRDHFVHIDLALYYARTGQPELALQRLETAITLAPDSGEVLAMAAEAHEVMGNRDEAIDMAKRSLESGYTRQQLRRNAELADLLDDPHMAESL